MLVVTDQTNDVTVRRGPMCGEKSLHIDCDCCQMRGLACNDCMVTVLLGPPPELGFDDDERRALNALAEGGLIPPLRMVLPITGPVVESA